MKKIAVGECHTCTLRVGAKVRCWGLGSDAALGYGDDISQGNAPMDISPFVNVGGPCAPRRSGAA